jgi:NitT/TauT family transport system permease protein
MSGPRKILSALIPPLLIAAIAVLAMDAAARSLNEPFLLPTSGAVLNYMTLHTADLLASLWTTTKAALAGFFASLIVGILAAIALSTSVWIRRAFYPYTIFFQTVPIVAIAPMLVIWLDAGILSVAVSAFIVSVFPVIANTLDGLLSTDPALEDLFRLYGAGAWSRLWKLKLPGAIPSIMTGLRVAAGLAVIGTVVGEFLVGLMGSGEGLGVRIVTAKKYGHIDGVFASVLLASILGLGMFAAVNLADRFLLRHWHASERE